MLQVGGEEGLYSRNGRIGSNNIVIAFDLDWTLVKSIKCRFPKDENDWALLPNRISLLQHYQNNEYTIVIFTNQGYKGEKRNIMINRINNIIIFLMKENINPFIFVATYGNDYRKPNIGMWDKFSKYKNNIDIKNSVYIGDAGGRMQDHGNDDLIFAKNIGLKFYFPEEIFNNNIIHIPETQTMFIFVGAPAAGKTYFYKTRLEHLGYIHVNQDILKTKSKILKIAKQALENGESIAIDATNPKVEDRRRFIELAIEYKIPTLIIYFVRNGYQWNLSREKIVPDIAYNVYYKNLIEPNQQIDLVPVVELF